MHARPLLEGPGGAGTQTKPPARRRREPAHATRHRAPEPQGRQTDRQTDRRTDGQTDRQTDRPTDRPQTDGQTDRDRQTDGRTEPDRQTNERQTRRRTDGRTDRQTDRANRKDRTGRTDRTGQPGRQTRQTKDRPHDERARRTNKQRANEGAQPTALRTISALPDCSMALYCCQAYLMIRDRSASSASVAQERTKATVSSAGRPPASKTNGTSSPPEGG